MSVTLCQYTVGGLCCICTSGCLQAPTICAGGGNFSTNCCVTSACLYTNGICQCGSGNINSNCCILGQVICGIACVQGTCVVANCCVVAPILCATTCFIGNGSGLTNLPASGAMSLICTISVLNCPTVQFTGLTCDKYMLVFNNVTAHTVCGSNFCYPSICVNYGTGSSPTYITSGYYYTEAYTVAASTGGSYCCNASYIQLALSNVFTVCSTVGNGFSGTYFINGMSSGCVTGMTGTAIYINYNCCALTATTGAIVNCTTAKTAIQFTMYPACLQFCSGSISLYGISG